MQLKNSCAETKVMLLGLVSIHPAKKETPSCEGALVTNNQLHARVPIRLPATAECLIQIH